MTTEQRQFFATCVAAALFLAAVFSSVDMRGQAIPLLNHSQIAQR
jgi:tetrahydromethanopterin S-methyltransferase subunit F